MVFDASSTRRGGKWPVALAWLAFILLLLAGAAMAFSGPAYKAEWISLGASFSWLRRGAQLAIGAGVIGLLTLIVSGTVRRWWPALAGALISLAVIALIAMPMQFKQRAQSVPPIHDITTDMENPPQFKLLAPAREAAPNEVDYPGEKTARQQRAGYPNLKPLKLDVPLVTALEAVNATIKKRGWEVAGTRNNTIEATATTRWFGFKDDVAVRVTESSGGVRVDMRSASRLGKSDVGTNAERIQTFLEAVEAKADSL